MTPTIEDKARKVVADHAMDIQDEVVLLDQLGLLDDRPVVVPELWLVTCGDDDCTFCHHTSKGGGVLVEAPGDWPGEQIIRRLTVLGHTCESGQKFAQAAAIVDMWSELIIPDIQVR